MTQRKTPEADAQRAIVQALRFVLPRGAIVHHTVNEVTAGDRRGKIRQAILVGMGVHAGFADLIVLSEGCALFLEVKSKTGRLRPTQVEFRDAVQTQGFAWALVRSVDDALAALSDHGFATRARYAQRAPHSSPRPRRTAP